MDELNKLRDSITKNLSLTDKGAALFRCGWNALLSHLNGAAGEFDPVALKQAFTQASPEEIAIEPLYRWGARWQFDQMSARVWLADSYVKLLRDRCEEHEQANRKLESRLAESERMRNAFSKYFDDDEQCQTFGHLIKENMILEARCKELEARVQYMTEDAKGIGR
jgi:DNA-binding MarR family transcriptional regulator